MARKARKDSLDPSVSQVVHVWNRCIRAMALCGFDPITKVNRDYRRQWSRDRLEHLASVFAIEVLTYAIMHNHTHQVLRTRPDIARQWSAETVAWRWLMITPKRDRCGKPIEPTKEQVRKITANPGLVEKLRLRLSDVSFWMQSYAQHIAVRANREDEQFGHFWQARFSAHVLVDPAAVIRCMLYVDLNPIRAGLADSIADSDFTAAKDRLDDLRIHLATANDNQITLTFHSGSDSAKWERLDQQYSGWLSPIEIESGAIENTEDAEGGEVTVGDSTPRARRASRRGAIQMTLTKYLWLLELVGQQPRTGGSGCISPEAVSLLTQLNIEPTDFLESVWLFGRRFKSRLRRPVAENAPQSAINEHLVVAL